jgi:endonuclease-3
LVSKLGLGKVNKDPRVIKLLEFNDTIRPQELFEVKESGAAELLESDPFAFALAGVLDRGQKAEIIWTIPFAIKQKLGLLNPEYFLKRSNEDLEQLFRSLPYKPRYITDAPITVKGLSKIVVERYDGDTAKIWQNRTAAYVNSVFQQIHGVGPGIASMMVLLLERHFKLHFNDLDHQKMDVKPDIHVQRVFYRMGLIDNMKEQDALLAARRLNPEYPGALDAPLWRIGKQWCKPFSPICNQCFVNSVCKKEQN